MFINSLLSESRCLFYKTDKTTSFSWGVIQIIKIRYLNLWASEDWVFCRLTGNCRGDWWRQQRKGENITIWKEKVSKSSQISIWKPEARKKTQRIFTT